MSRAFRGLIVVCLGMFAGCQAENDAPMVPNTKQRIIRITPGENVQRTVQTALIEARPGDILEFGEGRFDFPLPLSLTVPNITLRGEGMEKTILSFAKQIAGAEGLLVTASDFRIENLTVEDTKGDGIKVNGASNVTFFQVRARWTGGSKTSNGAYGLYPVLCRNVLIDGCEVSGASDAGIYVGQSQNVVVRNCRAEQNVAGIEIENTLDADVHKNVATNNAGGILVFDLPGLEQKNGGRIRVFDNEVRGNNHVNFAPKGNTVADVPSGTGLMVMAAENVEVVGNRVSDNQTTGIAIVSYFVTQKPINDQFYDPYTDRVFVSGNQFSKNGTKPQGLLGTLLRGWIGSTLPDILYDGIAKEARKDPSQPPLVITNNGAATFANFNFPKNANLSALLIHRPTIDRDMGRYQGSWTRLPGATVGGTR